MEMTKHAIKRMGQRGINKDAIDLILNYGSFYNAKQGRIKIWLSRKNCQTVISALKKIIKQIERTKDAYLILEKDIIITVCHEK